MITPVDILTIASIFLGIFLCLAIWRWLNTPFPKGHDWH
jgi:hypothetical protein